MSQASEPLQMANQDVADFDELFEDCYPDGTETDREAFRTHIEELEATGFLIALKEGDRALYKARDGLKWANFHHVDCPIKKRILLYLSENPQAFFILFNTQKGKLGLICKEIRTWMSCPERVVAFLYVDNSKDLAQQSLDAMKDRLAAEGCRPFLLSSNSRDTVQTIMYYIDAYEHNLEYKMPIILVLANTKQGTKVASLLKHISEKCKNGSNLRHGDIFDEADAVYPVLREMLKPYLIDDKALHRVGWVSATEGSLLDEEYPECANAHQQQEAIDPADEANYRAIHLPEAVIHPMEIDRRESNNVKAMKLIKDNLAHFNRRITLRDGSVYYSKTIINSDGSISQMVFLAKQFIIIGFYALTYNQTGITLYMLNREPKVFKTRGMRFNELLFYIFETEDLWDKPVVIIGRRKIDRGLSFHYAPRPGAQPKMIDGKDGPLQTDGVKGLIWTDLILGKIENKATAAQKAGRGAAIMAHCPQYPGEIHYWMHPDTAKMVKIHNETVDQRNTIVGSNSALQAHVRATAIVAAAQPPPKNHEVDANTFRVFRDEASARGFCEVMGYRFRKPDIRSKNADGFYETSLNRAKEVVTLLEAVKKVPSQYTGAAEAVGGWRTFIPCYKDVTDPTTLRYLIIVRLNADKTVQDPEKLTEADRRFPAVPVPQTGPLDEV